MKKCQYCFEEIQSEAIKCKHCGEFLNKKETVSFFQNIKKLLPVKQDLQFSNPSDEQPLGNAVITFQSETFIWNDTIFPYDSILNIGYKPSVIKQNIFTTRKLIFTLAIFAHINGKDEFFEVNILSPKFSPLEITVDKNSFEIYQIIYNYVSAKTFEKRLHNYINLIKNNGFFSYMGFNFYEKGTIINADTQKVTANLLNAYERGNIGFGTNFSNLKSSIRTSDPYEFAISNGNPKLKVILFESGFDLKIQTIFDHDVFIALLYYFFEYKTFPTTY